MFWDSNGYKRWAPTQPITKKYFIKFKWQGQKYKLYSFQPPKMQVVSSQHMEKLIQKGASTYVIQCHQMEGEDTKQDESQEGDIQDLLQKHEKVFQNLPMQLPLERSIEHII